MHCTHFQLMQLWRSWLQNRRQNHQFSYWFATLTSRHSALDQTSASSLPSSSGFVPDKNGYEMLHNAFSKVFLTQVVHWVHGNKSESMVFLLLHQQTERGLLIYIQSYLHWMSSCRATIIVKCWSTSGWLAASLSPRRGSCINFSSLSQGMM